MSRKAFTLIELLIVVAIIAILAAIAVPNFLEAQTRSKVARARADMRTLAVGVQSYTVDWNRQPPLTQSGQNNENTYNRALWYEYKDGRTTYFSARMTSPIAYLTTTGMADPFNLNGESWAPANEVKASGYSALFLQGALKDPKYVELWSTSGGAWGGSYSLLAGQSMIIDGTRQNLSFMLASPGPGKKWHTHFTGIIPAAVYAQAYVNGDVPIYDPTNGTLSIGNILRVE